MSLAIKGIAGGADNQYPAFAARNSASQNVTSGVATIILFGTAIFDTNNNFASNRFTASIAGYYQFNGTIRGTATSLTHSSAYLYKNGVIYSQGVVINTAAISGTIGVSVSEVVHLNVGEYVELWGLVNGTSPSFNFTDSAICCKFSGCLLRPD